jgi:hypothetical protein
MFTPKPKKPPEEKHKIILFRWIDGVLHTVEEFFDKVEDAIYHGDSSDAHSYKVHDHRGELCHHGKGKHNEHHKHHGHEDCDDTYA